MRGFKISKETKIDITLILLVMLNYILNKSGFFLKIHLYRKSDVLDIILKNHFNDFLAGILICAYTHIILGYAKNKTYKMIFEKFYFMMLFILICGFFWEYAPSIIKKNAVADLLDIVSYTLGAILYWMTLKIVSKDEKSKGDIK